MGWGGTLTSIGGGAGGSVTVSNYSPAAGQPITPSTALSFDVASSLATINSLVITVLYPATGASEVVYNRDGFGANFTPNGLFLGCERSLIAGGFHFIIRRRGGWYSSPEIRIEGGDTNGNAITQ